MEAAVAELGIALAALPLQRSTGKHTLVGRGCHGKGTSHRARVLQFALARDIGATRQVDLAVCRLIMQTVNPKLCRATIAAAML